MGHSRLREVAEQPQAVQGHLPARAWSKSHWQRPRASSQKLRAREHGAAISIEGDVRADPRVFAVVVAPETRAARRPRSSPEAAVQAEKDRWQRVLQIPFGVKHLLTGDLDSPVALGLEGQ